MGDRTAALVVRVWVEGQGGAVRARLLDEDGRTLAVAGSTDRLLDELRHWVEGVVRAHSVEGRPPG